MAVSLLRYANREKVAQALTERGYSVTRMTVNRWAKGAEMPLIAERMIAELFGHPDATKEAAPDWERLMRTVDAIAERVGVNLEEERAAAIGADAALALPLAAESEGDPAADARAGAPPPGRRGR